MKKSAVRIVRVVGALLVILSALLILVQTPPGKAALASMLERMLSGSDNLDVRIGKISGWIPASIYIDRLEIGDAEGLWLTADGLHCRWILRDLRTATFRFARVGAESIEMHRFPEGGQSERSSEPVVREPGAVEVVLDELAVGELKLGKEIAGIPLNYSVSSGGIILLPSGRLSGELRVQGDAEGRVMLDALLGGADSRLQILAEIEQMVNPMFGMDHLSGNAEAVISDAGVRSRVTARVRKDELDGLLDVELEYTARDLQVPYFKAAFGERRVEGRAQMDFGDHEIGVRLDAATDRLSLHAAATATVSNRTWRVTFHPLELSYLNLTTATLEGEIGPERLALDGSLSEFELNELPLPGISNFTGQVSGALLLSGTPAEPEVAAALDVTRFTSVEEVLDELPELDLHVSGALTNGQLSGFSFITNAVRGSMAATFSMPCGFSLDPFEFKPEPRAMHADIRADVDLDILNRLAIFSDQRVAGRLEMDLAYNEEPSGFLRLHEGAYEHYKWGLVLRDLSVHLEAEEDGMRVASASATDGGAGRITLSGGFFSNRLDLAMDLFEAAVIRRDEVEGSLSGHLAIGGMLSRPEVGGLLTVNRMEFLLDNVAPALPVRLTDYDVMLVTNRNVSAKEAPTLPVGLDLEVDLADQVYVISAMGDSIWGGGLRIRDVPGGIAVQGAVKPVRGYVSFIGKKFRLIDGQIDLDGAVPLMPMMNRLTAEYSRGDFSAQLVLNGRADNPNLQLESNPAMPQDEILSYVLFGEDTSSISPYQAYQLAAAARQLSGGISGPGFMYQMRQAVGVDTLEWREGASAEEASSLAAGKYLTSSLYVEVNRSLDEKGQTGMMAEYEVTKHFSVETSTGPKMRPGIGINWKNDY